MDQNTKQRLVGITVIFALAVIFLPMILDGSGVKRKPLKVDIPASFQLDENPDFEKGILELLVNVEELPSIQSNFIDEMSEALPEIKRIESDQAMVKIEAKSRKSDPVVSTVVSVTKEVKKEVEQEAGGEAYVLQVGSFKDRAKATLLRDKLRESKISAVFVEKFNTNSNLSYRVRLGPFVNRQLSKIARNKVKAKYNIDGLIMQYEL
jgi:DedD protein